MPSPKASDFVLQLHFHPTGKPEIEKARPSASSSPTSLLTKADELGCPGLFGLLAGLDIPPGEKNFTIKDRWRMQVDMRAFP